MHLTFTPQADIFEKSYDKGQAQLVVAELAADMETPVSAYLKLCPNKSHDKVNSFLLESVEDGDIRGRYSIIGMEPDLIFRVEKGKAFVNRRAQLEEDNFEAMNMPVLDGLRAILKESHIDMDKTMPPMAAGIFGYMGYDMVRYMESLPDQNSDPLGVPESLFVRPSLMAVFDAVTNRLQLVAPVYPQENMTATQAYDKALHHIQMSADKLAQPVPTIKTATDIAFAEPSSNMTREQYYDMVHKARAYIEEGEIFQIVLSQRFATPFKLPPFELYRALRRVNPSPYLFFLNFADFSIVGSSPELLVGLRNNKVTIRPIAGTRKRGQTATEDEKIGAELLADEKERAEHLMLLDLGRNDVGRVAEIGSVQVTKAFGLQKTSHLIHIVSDVEGQLAAGHDQLDTLAAGFPAGTVSGAPKIRAMEIIDELEPIRRSIYAGCVGYFSANGDMDSCITLRTGVIKDGMLYVQAGGGIVHDSTPEYEFEETVNKAKALFRAAEEAINMTAPNKQKP